MAENRGKAQVGVSVLLSEINSNPRGIAKQEKLQQQQDKYIKCPICEEVVEEASNETYGLDTISCEWI